MRGRRKPDLCFPAFSIGFYRLSFSQMPWCGCWLLSLSRTWEQSSAVPLAGLQTGAAAAPGPGSTSPALPRLLRPDGLGSYELFGCWRKSWRKRQTCNKSEMPFPALLQAAGTTRLLLKGCQRAHGAELLVGVHQRQKKPYKSLHRVSIPLGEDAGEETVEQMCAIKMYSD